VEAIDSSCSSTDSETEEEWVPLSSWLLTNGKHGTGIESLSTSRGIMTDREARLDRRRNLLLDMRF